MSASLATDMVQISRLALGGERLVLGALLPESGDGSFDDQMASLCAAARATLFTEGLAADDMVHLRIFLSDAGGQAMRARALIARAGLDRGALTLIGQPPAQQGHHCALQMIARRGGATGRPDGSATIRRWSMGGSLFIWIAGTVASAAVAGTPRTMTAEQEAAAMYDKAARDLAREGLTFRQVIRTWISLRDIDRDYASLNRARRAFYQAHGVAPPPASTGIGGTPERDRRFSLDVLALAMPGSHPAAGAMHAHSMNEAPSYGADFSRGTRVALKDRALLFISGTASIDPHGEVAHPGDIAAQARCMLDRVTDLLAQQGARPADLAQAVTYIKDRSFLGPLREALAEKGFPAGIPHTVCVADVCRPGWLCEMEALASVPLAS